MTREKLITISRESGLEYYGLGKDRERFIAHLQRFAVLLLASTDPQSSMSWQEGNEVGRLAEREACAKVVLGIANDDAGNPYKQALRIGAEAIRARGQA
jgi:hypothetical protein